MITVIPHVRACVASFPPGTERSTRGAVNLIPDRPVRITADELSVLQAQGYALEVREGARRPAAEAEAPVPEVAPAEAPAEAQAAPPGKRRRRRKG